MSDTKEDVKTNVEPTSDTTDTTEEETIEEGDGEEQKQNEKQEPTSKEDAKKQDEPEEPLIDYKAELAKAEAKAERARNIATWERSQRKKLQKSQQTGHVEEEDTASDIDSKLVEFRREQAMDMVDEELEDIENEDERKLVKLFYDSRIIPSGYTRKAIKEDIAFARDSVNKPLRQKQLFERAKAEAKKELEEERALASASHGTSGGRRAPSTSHPVPNDREKKWLDYVAKAKAKAERRSY